MLISVYIPTKNRAQLLLKAIQSVQAQTHAAFELIVVDDGSTDVTNELLADLAAQDPRIRQLRQCPSRGATMARNTAILAAQGPFVTGLDDDDEFTPDRLALFLRRWQALEAAGETPSCLYSNLTIMQGGTAVRSTDKPQRAVFEDMFRENVVGNQIFAPKQHYLDAGLFLEGLPAWQDLEFFMRVLKRFGPARLVPQATYHWDNSPRQDRVSRESEHKMRHACETVCRLHCPQSPRRQQQLYLQLFGRFYGIKPKASDYQHFLSNPKGLLKLLRSSLVA